MKLFLKQRRMNFLSCLRMCPILLTALTVLFIPACATDGGGASPTTELRIESSGFYGTLTVPDNGVVTAPEGKQVTMTKNGKEIGFEAGKTYTDVYVTVTDAITLPYTKSTENDRLWEMDYRTALYVDTGGISAEKSVTRAIGGGTYTDTAATGFLIVSEGENFNGIIVTGEKSYTIKDPVIRLTGNGGNDFKGFGAGILAAGKSRVVVDGADIRTEGVVRTALVAGQGSKVLVKDSYLSAKDGLQEPGYVGTVDTSGMKSVPWMLGLTGNCRATNLLNDAVITYYNSEIYAERWGVLSTDENDGLILTAVNSKVAITGESGYGTYSIGDTTVTFAGVELDVPDYAAICANGASSVIFTSSDAATLTGVYGLEGTAVEERKTVINSGRFGVMYHSSAGTGQTRVIKGTEFNTGLTAFLVKGCPTNIEVDDAVIIPGNKVILQLMDNDDAGIDPENGMATTVSYVEPDSIPTPVEGRDLGAAVKGTDVIAVFKNTTLEGDIYNSSGYASPSGGAPGGDVPGGDAPGGDAPGTDTSATSALNLGITLNNVTYTGAISSSKASHTKKIITPNEYYLIGIVSNEPRPAVNNGVSVTLEGNTTWTVTGTSYLNKLVYGAGCTITGQNLSAKVDGTVTNLTAGNTYTGKIEIIVD
jgi:hypothetical protein